MNNKEKSNVFKVLKDKFIVAPFKYVTVFVAGVVFASGLVYAWNPVWHGTDWVQSGKVINAKSIGESLQYLYEQVESLKNELGAVSGNNTSNCIAQRVSGKYVPKCNDRCSTSKGIADLVDLIHSDPNGAGAPGIHLLNNLLSGNTYYVSNIYFNCPKAADGEIVNCRMSELLNPSRYYGVSSSAPGTLAYSTDIMSHPSFFGQCKNGVINMINPPYGIMVLFNRYSTGGFNIMPAGDCGGGGC